MSVGWPISSTFCFYGVCRPFLHYCPCPTAFRAAAPKGLMTYAFIPEIFPPSYKPPPPAQIPALRLESQPWRFNRSLQAPNSASRLLSQPQSSNPSIEAVSQPFGVLLMFASFMSLRLVLFGI